MNKDKQKLTQFIRKIAQWNNNDKESFVWFLWLAICILCDTVFSSKKTNFPLRYTIYYLWLLDILIAHSWSVLCTWSLDFWPNFSLVRNDRENWEKTSFFFFVWWWMKVKWISLRKTFWILLRIKLQLHHNNCFVFSGLATESSKTKIWFYDKIKMFLWLLLNEIHLLNRIEFDAIYKKYRPKILRPSAIADIITTWTRTQPN